MQVMRRVDGVRRMVAVSAGVSMLVACGGGDSSDGATSQQVTLAPPVTTVAPAASPTTTAAPAAATTTAATTTVPVTPQSALADLVESEGFGSSSGVLETACGELALVTDRRVTQLRVWDGASWVPDRTAAEELRDTPSRLLDSVSAVDLTGDGVEELVISWELDPSSEQRPWGSVLWGGESGCEWELVWMVDSCGGELVTAGLTFDRRDGLIGSGFPSACSGRDTVVFEWVNGADAFVGRSLRQSATTCDEYTFNIDLHLALCDESWAVEMVQAYLADRGYAVQVDGYFGPGTQTAVMHFQQSNGLVPDGLVGPITWSTMYPAGGWEAPDYDGDGVSSPREMAHS